MRIGKSARTRAGEDDTAHAAERLDRIHTRLGISIQNLHLGQACKPAHIKLRACGVTFGRRTIERHLVGIDITEKAQLARAESLHAIGVGLGDIARAVDFIVHHHQHTLAARHRRSCDSYRAQQIERPIGADRRCRALRTDDDHRLIVLHREMQKIRGLFECVGAVRDHHARNLLILTEDRIDARREFQPDCRIHVLAADIRDLFDAHLCVVFDFRHRFDQLGAEDRPGFVFAECGARTAAAGDGAAGGQHHHQRQFIRCSRCTRRVLRQQRQRVCAEQRDGNTQCAKAQSRTRAHVMVIT